MNELFIILLDKEFITINSDSIASMVKLKICESINDKVLFEKIYSHTKYIRFSHGLNSGRYIVMLESDNSKVSKRVTI
ncbi:MAG: hypothetical protein DRI86_02875 [Bacteroidetes bacterium]|nr:MAG: hypothetical protein DRI86_02875 [Bacteroidota bacterium]